MAALRDDPSWEPRRRVQASVRKLQGASPATLLIEELGINKRVKMEKSFDALSSMIKNACGKVEEDSTTATTSSRHVAATGKRGSSGGSQRAPSGGGRRANVAADSAGDVELPVESQVDALIALATDPNIVVRQWVGLAPWI